MRYIVVTFDTHEELEDFLNQTRIDPEQIVTILYAVESANIHHYTLVYIKRS